MTRAMHLANGGALVVLLVCALPSRVVAQQDYSRLNVSRGAELSLFGGATAAATGSAPRSAGRPGGASRHGWRSKAAAPG